MPTFIEFMGADGDPTLINPEYVAQVYPSPGYDSPENSTPVTYIVLVVPGMTRNPHFPVQEDYTTVKQRLTGV